MSNTQMTLNHFFSFDEKKVSKNQLKEVESSENMSRLRGRVAKQTGTHNRSVMFCEVLKNIDKLLDIKIADIMISAWRQKGILHKYTDSKKHPPDEIVMLPLVEHTIRSVHKPSIEVLVNGTPVGKINFNIDLALTLKGTTLKVKGGKIMEILTGSCVGKGTIKCENVMIFEKKTESFSLPGLIVLGDGISVIA